MLPTRSIATVAILCFVLVGLAGCKKENAYVAPPPPQVGVAHPLSRQVTPELDSTGNTAAYNEVDLVARVEGFLQEIDYTDGSLAKPGKQLFLIEPAPYQAKLQQAQAQLDAANAALVQSKAEFQRQATLLQQNVTAQNTFDQAKAKYASDQANVLNQTAGVAIAGINFGYTHVTAPFDGVVTNHLVSVGELVGVTSPTKLATIVQLDPIYVNFTVSEQDVLRIKAASKQQTLTPDQISQIPVEVGLMTDTGYPLSGNLNYISPTLDPSTGTLAVRAIFKNANRALLPGFFVRVRIPLRSQTAPALLVPNTALGTDQAGRYLLVVNKDNVVEQRSVQAGQVVGALRVISSGITADDQVVITGLQHAIPGAKVAPQPTPMPKS